MSFVEITEKQVKKIWTMASLLNLSEEKLRRRVKRVSGQRSIRGLTKQQAIEVIDRLVAEQKIKTDHPNVIYLVTRKQLELIDYLACRAGWDCEHLQNFINRQFKITNPGKLRRKEAGVVINVLKHAIAKQGVAA